MKELMKQVLQNAKIEPICEVPHGAQCVQRGEISILTNHAGQELTFSLPRAVRALSGLTFTGQELKLPPFGFAVVQECNDGFGANESVS